MIASIVDQKKPAQGEKGQYGYVRQAETKPKRARKKRVVKSIDHALDDVSDYVAPNGLAGMSATHMGNLPAIGMQRQDLHGLQVIQGMHHSTGMYAQMPAPAGTPLDRSSMRRSPAEEEMDEESSDWVVRVGDAEPPPWAKRLGDEDLEEQHAHKRQRLKYGLFFVFKVERELTILVATMCRRQS